MLYILVKYILNPILKSTRGRKKHLYPALKGNLSASPHILNSHPLQPQSSVSLGLHLFSCTKRRALGCSHGSVCEKLKTSLRPHLPRASCGSGRRTQQVPRECRPYHPRQESGPSPVMALPPPGGIQPVQSAVTMSPHS